MNSITLTAYSDRVILQPASGNPEYVCKLSLPCATTFHSLNMHHLTFADLDDKDLMN